MKAVIFDMDGVIVDTEDHYPEGIDEIMSSFIPEWDDKEREHMMGMTLERSYEHLKERFAITISLEHYLGLWDELDTKVFDELCQPMHGLIPLLETLQKNNILLAIATSSRKRNAEKIVKRFTLHHFDLVVSADEIKCKSKPAPDVFIHTAKELKIPPEQCTVIEDSGNGIRAAKAAAMRCIGLTGSPHQDVSGADVVVDSLTEISLEMLFPGESL